MWGNKFTFIYWCNNIKSLKGISFYLILSPPEICVDFYLHVKNLANICVPTVILSKSN
jgi:hypothetical protein